MKLCHHQEYAIYSFSQILGRYSEKEFKRLKIFKNMKLENFVPKAIDTKLGNPCSSASCYSTTFLSIKREKKVASEFLFLHL